MGCHHRRRVDVGCHVCHGGVCARAAAEMEAGRALLSPDQTRDDGAAASSAQVPSQQAPNAYMSQGPGGHAGSSGEGGGGGEGEALEGEALAMVQSTYW